MSTVEHKPGEAKPLRPPSSDIVIASPIKREEKGKTSPLKIVLGVAMGVLMVFFIVIMFVVMGRQPNPMMLMGYTVMMVTVVGGAGAALMQGMGGGDGDLDRKRQNIDLQLAESAIDVHETAAAQHAAALHFHPNPANLRRLIEQRAATFWSGDVTAEAEQALLRVGVGTEQLAVQLTPAESAGAGEAQEHLYEEYSAVAVSRFRSLMSVVPEVPLARETSSPAYGFRGDQEGINGLVRSMLLSATYKYSPNKVLVGVITRDTKTWGWMKWLPHSRNRLREPGPAGYRQLAWRTVDDFLADMSDQFDALAVTGTRMYVVVDDPDLVLRFPAEYPDGIPGVTFLAAKVYSDDEVTKKKHSLKMRVDGDRLRLHQSRVAARADYVSRFDAELTARAMAPIRPEGYGFDASLQPAPEQPASAVDAASLPSIMEHLGIGNVDDFDLKTHVWDPNEYNSALETMFGHVLDENNAPTGELATLDLREVAAGGTGAHGMMSGGTGTGKSFMMTAIVLGLILANSPSKLRLIMADFKGGPTWRKFQGRIGHEVATITNLEEANDLLERLNDVLEGEIIYRQTLFSKFKEIDNIRQYRERHRTHPDMEQLPYLMFIADEVHEFLKANPEYRAVFERLGRIGRSLGLILLLASQYLDEQAVGDFVKHAMYGISLKVTKPNESKTVLNGNDNAIRLPSSMVALFYKTVNMQDTVYQRVKAWNWESPYRRPVKDVDPPTAPGASPAVPGAAQVHVEDVAEFGMYHRPLDADAPADEGPEPVRAPKTEESTMNIAEAGIRLVERCSRQYVSRELWTEPLRHPLSIPHVADGWTPEPGKLQLRIGDVDVPRKHSRIPMIVDFTGSNCLVAGGEKTGKTNTIRAMIAASELTYPSDQMSWYIYDYAGSDLAGMATWPNVGGYASKTDEDMFSRLWGEINRIIDLRTDVIGDNRIRNVDNYLARKAELGVTGDPYGHIFLAVDGLDRILDDAGQEYMPVRDEWVQLLAYGPRVGVHVVYTTRTVTGRMPKLVEVTGAKVYHNMEDPQVMDTAIRTGIRAIPITMPGGSINADNVDSNNRPQILRSRVFVPITERIQPDSTRDGMPVFAIRDYSMRVEEVGAQKRATAPTVAPPIQPVPNAVPYANLIDVYKHIDMRAVRPGARMLPMGVDRATGRALALELARTRHMFIAGTGQSGVSTALRTAINSITNVYRPEEASIIILDGRMGLVDLVPSLEAEGYMQKGRFASNNQIAVPIITKIGELMQSRQPTGTETPVEVRDREYVKGKEVFVIVDGFDTLRAVQAGASAPGTLEWLGPKIPIMDVGVHLLVGAEGSGITRWVGMNKFTSSLTARSDVRNVFLNGNPGEGKILLHEKVKFRKLPVGRAIWHSAGGSDTQIIQIANSEEIR